MSQPTTRVSRRSVLLGGAAAAGLTVAGPVPSFASSGPSDPFTLGVASGDPTPDGVLLWTRLAPNPLAEDGSGGMPGRVSEVLWELAEDERFSRVVRRDLTQAAPELGHSVHVELRGLEPGREYFYRFRVGSHLSPVGRTRTAPAPDAESDLSLCFASCAQYEHGYFTAYRRLAEDNPDLVLHLGDYQYEYKAGVYVAPGGNPRDHEGPETETLAHYRQRHAQYKTDPDLQAAHAIAPWVVVWDDHELDNNWADDAYEKPEIPQPNFLERRKAAFQAYYENMPLRRASVPQGIDMQLYRRVQWGRLATFHMLDTRQYRDDQACGDGQRIGCDERLDAQRSITGEEQEKWLLDGFRRSDARWDVIGQQVFFAQRDSDTGPLESYSMDAWDGYVASRDRITRGWVDADVRNAVVLTGDVHANWAADLKLDYHDPNSATVGVELVTTSITSGGDGSDSSNTAVLEHNPHLKFHQTQRGYVRARFNATELRADYRVLPYVQKPGAPVSTRASFVVQDGEAGLHPA